MRNCFLREGRRGGCAKANSLSEASYMVILRSSPMHQMVPNREKKRMVADEKEKG